MTLMTLRNSGPFMMWVTLTVLVFCFLSGCRKQNVVTCLDNQGYDPKLGICYDCPPGTKADHGSATCVAVDGDDATDSSTAEDIRTDDNVLPDDTEDNPDELSADHVADSESPDVQHEDVILSGAIGSACNMDTDCEDGFSCFDWPGGYCILPDCGFEVDCPEGSECLPLMQNAQACFDHCEVDLDCRPGYGCKSIATIGGEARDSNPAHRGRHAGRPLGGGGGGDRRCQGLGRPLAGVMSPSAGQGPGPPVTGGRTAMPGLKPTSQAERRFSQMRGKEIEISVPQR